MEQNTDRQYAKHLLNWIKSLSWEENNTRTDAVLKFEINPFIDDDGASETEIECLKNLTFDDIEFITETLAAERTDVFKIYSLRFKYDGDLEEGIIEVESEIHLAE